MAARWFRHEATGNNGTDPNKIRQDQKAPIIKFNSVLRAAIASSFGQCFASGGDMQGFSTIRLRHTATPDPSLAFSSQTLANLRGQIVALGLGRGERHSFATSSWAGWINVLAVKPHGPRP